MSFCQRQKPCGLADCAGLRVKIHIDSCLWMFVEHVWNTRQNEAHTLHMCNILPKSRIDMTLSISTRGISCIEHDLFDVLEPRRLGAALDFQPWRDFAEKRPRFRSC